MSYWIYSEEAFPRQEWMGKGLGYTPEYMSFYGVQLGPVPAREWISVPSTFTIMRHSSYRDGLRQNSGTRDVVQTEDLVKALRPRFEPRGVVFLDHKPLQAEREQLEKEMSTRNLKFRAHVIEEYEQQVREKETTGNGRIKPTPYEEECYTLLGRVRPFSVEDIEAKREPGKAVVKELAAALREMQRPAVPVDDVVEAAQA